MSKHSAQTLACKKNLILSNDITMRHIVAVEKIVKKKRRWKQRKTTEKKTYKFVYANKVVWSVNIAFLKELKTLSKKPREKKYVV